MIFLQKSCFLASILTIFLSASPVTFARPTNTTYQWTLTATNSTQQFRGLSPVSDRVIWVSGTNGTVLRSTNRGADWKNVSPKFLPSENSTTFQFRDIQAWSSKSAVVLSIGEGNASRIYHTSDGGQTWAQTFVNEEATAFYDCMAFEKGHGKENHGLAMSDPVDGKFRLIETWDGGRSWNVLPSATSPLALTGEFGFAASGTCIEAAAGRWYIATGGVDPGRIFYTDDVKSGWNVSNSSITGGAAAGVFSVRFRDAKHGIAVGGDFEKPTANIDIAAWSDDGGLSWEKAESFPQGYRSGLSWLPGSKSVAVAVGTSGSDITLDGGRSWTGIDNGTFDAVECIDSCTCWASGSRGRVARLVLNE